MSRLVLYISLSVALHLLAVFPLLAEQFASDAQAAALGARVEPVALALPKVRMQTAQAKPVVSEVVSEAVLEKVSEQPLVPAVPVVEPSQPKPQSKPAPQPQPVSPVAVQQRKAQPTPQAKTAVQAQVSKPVEPLRSKPEAKIEDSVAAQVKDQPGTAAVESASTQVAAPIPADAAPTTAVQATQAESVPAEVISTQPRFARAPAPPVYPAQAKRRQQQGTVWVEVRLNARGAQLAVQVLRTSGVPSLDKAALVAVRKWQFLPEQHNGVGVPSRVHIPIEFAIAAHR